MWGDTGGIDISATGNIIASGKTMAAQSITASGGAIGTWGGELSAPLVMLYALPNQRRVRSHWFFATPRRNARATAGSVGRSPRSATSIVSWPSSSASSAEAPSMRR